VARDEQRRAVQEQRRTLCERYDRLTARERQVFLHVSAGRLNKQIAADLGASERTIKAHRAQVMEKMAARSLADLVRAADKLSMSLPNDIRYQR
ncbi:MAG: response regulator transcription factor, partial [Burkholderiales bacterium]